MLGRIKVKERCGLLLQTVTDIIVPKYCYVGASLVFYIKFFKFTILYIQFKKILPFSNIFYVKKINILHTYLL